MDVTYTIRDLEGHVLRRYLESNGTWTWKEDDIWGPNGLLATVSPSEGTKHDTLDHLGSPRLVCDRGAHTLAKHNYFPYGEEATSPGQDSERIKFTGQERDLNLTNQTTDDLDYMHARYDAFNIGRFMTVDPVRGSIDSSQSWDGYAYVRGNPILLVDETGEILNVASMTPGERRRLQKQLEELSGLRIKFINGNFVIIGTNKNAEGKPVGSKTARRDLKKAIASRRTYYVRVNPALRGLAKAYVAPASRTGTNMDINPLMFQKVNTGANDPKTFNEGMVFFHELSHLFGRTEPTRAQLAAMPWAKGKTVRHVNEIRRELGLPVRERYLAGESHGRTFIFFSNGPVFIPSGAGD